MKIHAYDIHGVFTNATGQVWVNPVCGTHAAVSLEYFLRSPKPRLTCKKCKKARPNWDKRGPR